MSGRVERVIETTLGSGVQCKSNLHFLSDIGRVRDVNQDAACVLNFDFQGSSFTLAFVFDGMGGHCYGEEISQLSKEILVSSFDTDFESLDVLLRHIEKQLRIANDVVFSKFKGKGGTTAVGYLFTGETVYWWNIGDSRLYLYDYATQEYLQVTTDHNLMQYELDKGLITFEESLDYKRPNPLTNALGIELNVEVSTGSVFVANKHIGLLLCSDGFYRRATKSMIIGLFENKLKLSDCVDTLMSLGERDNITVILNKFER